MSVFKFIGILLASFCCITWGLPITSLPGLSANVSFAQYSGYVTVDKASNRSLFYWFVESQQATAKTDPVVVWFQGGPGCSSLIGLFTEHGPFVPTPNGDLELNPLSWNRLVNVLYVEAPVGVGFSYSDNQTDYNTNDTLAAADNLIFLELFFSQEFPQYQQNDLWIAGESYAGVYIPWVVQNILNESQALSKQLKGFMIGNPVIQCLTVQETEYTIQVQLFFWHGLIPFATYQKWMQSTCAEPNLNLSQECLSFYNDINNLIGYYNPDNLYTDNCTGNATLDATSTQNPGCISYDDNTVAYLNKPEVQKAIHARPTEWQECVGSPQFNYSSSNPSMLPFYEYIFSKAPHIRILIYSGDVDIATVPHALTQTCLTELQRPLVQPWRPWTVNGQTAGYVEVRDKFTFATIKGAGHEVPTYQPWPAYNMFQRFLSNQPL